MDVRTERRETMGTLRLKAGVEPLDLSGLETTGTKMLLALTALGKHVYEGTVSPAEKDRRRRQNKSARQARRAHRRAGAR
jgi:hypothetical protein